MPITVPEAFKTLTSYIKRAEELDKNPSSADYRVVSYFCKKYALEQAMATKINSSEANTFFSTLLITLEKEKPNLGVSMDEAPIVCENFAFSVFSKADEEDRQGQSTKTTAKMFYSAASFYDILEQFGELSNEVVIACQC
jgi:vacuolar protein sorting-associated protein VTA1